VSFIAAVNLDEKAIKQKQEKSEKIELFQKNKSHHKAFFL